MFFATDLSVQLLLLTAVTLLSYFIASAMDGVMGEDGFGILGNLSIVVAGFYAGVWTARYFALPVRDLTNAVVAGLTGAFVALFVLAVTKAVLNRFA